MYFFLPLLMFAVDLPSFPTVDLSKYVDLSNFHLKFYSPF